MFSRKMAKKAVWVFVLCMMGILASCAKLNEPKLTDVEKVQKMLSTMQTYVTKATVVKNSNKSSITYETKQYGKMTGEYRVEFYEPDNVNGCVIVFDGTTTMQYNPKVQDKLVIEVAQSKARDEMFLSSFLKNYSQTKEVSIAAGDFEKSECTVLEAKILDPTPNLAYEKLWVNNQTLKPVKLVIYDTNDKETIVVTYNDFSYNVKIDDASFKLQ